MNGYAQHARKAGFKTVKRGDHYAVLDPQGAQVATVQRGWLRVGGEQWVVFFNNGKVRGVPTLGEAAYLVMRSQ